MYVQKVVLSLFRTLLLGSLFNLPFLSLSQDNAITPDNSKLKVVKHSIGPNGFDEMMISQIRRDGGSDERVMQYLDFKKKQWGLMKAGVNPTTSKTILPKPFACGNVDVETGNFSGWTGQVGSTNGTPSPTWSSTGIVAGQHGIAPPPATDPCANVPGFPITLPAPNGGNHSIQLGNNITGCGAEQLSFTFIPTINDTLFTYQYAVVFEDPGHGPTDQPFFEFYMLDINGDTVPCSHQRYIAAAAIPGFQNSTSCVGVKYKPWSLVGINLAAYVGQPVTLFAVTADCNQCGHFGYAYIDFSCTPGTMPVAYCLNATTFSLCVPGGGAGYTYKWETGQTGSCITITAPTAGDTIGLVITPPGVPSCPFPIDVILTPVLVHPGFQFSIACGNMVAFTDTSNFSPSGVALNYSWNFGDPASGASNTSTNQHPSHLFSAPGTYIVTLSTMATVGTNTCGVQPWTDTVVIVGPPVSVFVNNSPCVGSPTIFTDSSTASSGGTITSWSWNFGDPASGSNTSNLQNPSHVFSSAGTFSVMLTIIDNKGCTDFSSQLITVHPPPVAAFKGYGSGCAPLCPVQLTDTSDAIAGTITSWKWTFPGGNPGSSTAQNPTVCYSAPGTYSASLVVTTSNGCSDSVAIGPIADVYAWPVADFCIEPNPASTTDPVFLFCDQWTSDVSKWTWNFGDGGTDVVNTDPVHSYSASINANDFFTFNICVNVENVHGCWDSICKTVEIVPEFGFYIPNTFTPNNNGVNDFFFGKGIGIMEYEIWLFDRWGNLIWKCHQIGKSTDWDGPGQDGMPAACKWDGKVVSGGADMNGNSGFRSQEDVYVWKVELTDIYLVRHNYVGHVNVVR